jgi:hypothetical protein
VLAGIPGTSTNWDASLGARLAGSIREACVAELGLQVSAPRSAATCRLSLQSTAACDMKGPLGEKGW